MKIVLPFEVSIRRRVTAPAVVIGTDGRVVRGRITNKDQKLNFGMISIVLLVVFVFWFYGKLIDNTVSHRSAIPTQVPSVSISTSVDNAVSSRPTPVHVQIGGNLLPSGALSTPEHYVVVGRSDAGEGSPVGGSTSVRRPCSCESQGFVEACFSDFYDWDRDTAKCSRKAGQFWATPVQ